MIIRAADYIARLLKENGYEDVFMLTGGGAMFLNNGFGISGLKCHFMLHEQALAIAAEGYARTCGKPAVVCVTTGPGRDQCPDGRVRRVSGFHPHARNQRAGEKPHHAGLLRPTY